MRLVVIMMLSVLLSFAWATEPVKSDTVTIIAVGDIMVTSRGTALLDRVGISYGLDSLRAELATGDVRFGNQEAPIGTIKTGRFDKKYTFLTPPRHAEVLVDGGFDVVSLANNHAMDYGMPALKETFAWLESKGIKWAGAGLNLKDSRKPAIIERNGVTYGFLAYSNTYPEEFWSTPSKGGNPFGHASYLKKDIPALRDKVDYLFVSFHWGSEKMTATKTYQKELGRLAIDLGADGVFAHHPHVLQGFEHYKGKPIAYSLGNFLFASWSNSVWDSAILKVRFVDGKFLGAELVPILVNNFQVELQPRILRGEAAQKSLSAMAELSSVWGTEIRIENDRGYFGPVMAAAPPKPAEETVVDTTISPVDTVEAPVVDSVDVVAIKEDTTIAPAAPAQEVVEQDDSVEVEMGPVGMPVEEVKTVPETVQPVLQEIPVEEPKSKRRRRNREK